MQNYRARSQPPVEITTAESERMTPSPNLFIFVLAIPIFVISIIWEWRRSIKERAELYDVADTLTNLQLGTGQLLVGLLVKTPLFGLYYLTHQWACAHGVPAWSETSWITWGAGFILMDLAYYWFHRLSHEHNLLWAAHAVHHQSEYYNLSVALRQSWIQQIYSGIFYLPLALVGISTEMFFMLNALNTLSQFWIHTQLIGRLGPLELIFNTPSHHRVHHGTDDPYVDKNYAGFLIIWDRIFGTFALEEDAPRYGLIKPLKSWNPTWANLEVWLYMWRRARRDCLSWAQRLSLPLRPPAWRGAQEPPLSIQLRTAPDYQRYKARGPLFVYGVSMGILDIMVGSYVVSAAPALTTPQVALWVIYLLACITVHSACVEGDVWAKRGAWMQLGVALGLPLITPWGWPHELTTPLVGGVWCTVHLVCAGLLYTTQRRGPTEGKLDPSQSLRDQKHSA